MKTIGPLNRAPEFFKLEPGLRMGGVLVTRDRRVLLIRPNRENHLLFSTETGNVWYRFEPQKVLTLGADYPVRRAADKDWNAFSEWLNEPPQMGECWEVDLGSFTYPYRSEQEARTAAQHHKEQFGGIGGTWKPMGWEPVRPMSAEEAGTLTPFAPIPRNAAGQVRVEDVRRRLPADVDVFEFLEAAPADVRYGYIRPNCETV